MASVLFIIFAVELAVVLVNAVGAKTINDVLWALLNLLPVPTARLATEKRLVQAEYLRARAELKTTSSQDEFARWAKLRRQHDKLLEQLDKIKKSLEASRASFDMYLSAARLLLTYAPQWILPMWFAAQPVFWLPRGLFPHPIEWVVALPRAPTGSVSTASWQVACAMVLGLLVEGARALVPSRGEGSPAPAAPAAFAAPTPSRGPAAAAAASAETDAGAWEEREKAL